MSVFDVLDALGLVADGTDLVKRRRGCWLSVLVASMLFAGFMIYLTYFRS